MAASAACWGQGPSVAGVANAFSAQAGAIAPAEELSVYGAHLSASTVNNCFTGTVFPTTCGGASVTVNGYFAPMIFASPTQLNLVVPWEMFGGDVDLVVTTAGGDSQPFSLKVVPASPAFSSSGGFGSFLNGAGQSIAAGNPASPGDVIQSFPTGLGLATTLPADGAITPTNYNTAGTVRVTVGGVPARIVFSGLVAGSVALYQVNFQIPAGLLGVQPVVITVDGISSPPVNIPLVAGAPSAVSVTTAANLGTWPLGEIQLGLGASGGNGSYSWSVQTGSTLPPGLSLRADLPAYITPFAPEGLIGVATTPGTYNFTLSVASGTSSTTQSFSLKITPLTLRDGPALPDGFVGTPYSYQLTATRNGTTASIACTAGATNGITLSSGCLLAGTPTAAGAQSIPVRFSDGTDTIAQTLTVNVSALRFSSAALLPNAPQNAPYMSTLAASGGAGPYIYLLDKALPQGLSLAAGVIAGTPTAPQGKYTFALTVSDSASHSYTTRIAIDVTGAVEALPRIAQYGDLGDCTVGMGCSRAIGVSGGGTAPFTWNVTGLPPGMAARSGAGATLTYVSPGDVELWGAPTALGAYNMTVQVVDANGLNTTQIFPIRVSPLFVDGCLTTAGCANMPDGAEGTAYSSTFRIVGGVPPYTAALAPSRNVPTGLPTRLWVSPTAVSGFSHEVGQFLPLFQFTDSAGTANTLTVAEPVHFSGFPGATTVIDAYPVQYITLGQPYSLQLSACCAVPYVWYTAGGTGAPGLSLSNDGLLSGQATTAGIYTWLVQAGAGDAGTRQLNIVETPISFNGASLPAGTAGRTYSQPLTASGANGALTWSLGPGSLLPPGLTLDSSGTISGKPSAAGAYPFFLLATDSAGDLDGGDFTLSVYTACDLNKTGGLTTLPYVVQVVKEALGATQAIHDLNQDLAVNVIDAQIEVNSALGLGCSSQ